MATRWQVPPLASVAPDKTSFGTTARSGRLNTAAHLDDIEKAAYEEGFARGRTEGYQVGSTEAQAAATHLNMLLDHLSRPLKDVSVEVEHALIRLAMDAARRLVNEAMQINPQQVAGAIHEAVAALASTPREMKIHVHPDDAAVLKQHLTLPAETNWKLIPDATLSRGDCRVVTESGQIDARLDTRQANITSALLGENT